MKTLGIISRIKEEEKPFGKGNYFLEDMIKEAENLPIKVFVFSPVDWKVGDFETFGYIFDGKNWHYTKQKIPQIIYDRFETKRIPENIEAIKNFRKFISENKNYYFATPVKLADLLKDKIKFHDFLIEHQLPTLKGIKIENLNQSLLNNFFSYNNTIYLKPIKGSGGHEIDIIIKTENNFLLKTENKNISLKEEEVLDFILKNYSNKEFFIQSKAKVINFNNSPIDIRVLIQNIGVHQYKITGMTLRVGEKNSWVSNLHSGGSGLPLENIKDFYQKNFNQNIENLYQEITDLSFKTCEIIHQKYGNFIEIALDILLTKDKGAMIIEGNSKPSRWIFNIIADTFPKNSIEQKKYLDLRKLSVKRPLIFTLNNKSFFFLKRLFFLKNLIISNNNQNLSNN